MTLQQGQQAGPQPFRLLGIAGSLRQASYNRGLLRAVAALLPAGIQFETYPLDEIPPFNADVMSRGDPQPGELIDGEIHARLAEFVEALVAWARLVGSPVSGSHRSQMT
ncbi:MAG: NAD(P)H-dependent oxidoreductase [Actinobacteria bacterium]|nr:NAD(P)H-dependent oxidoreductase [Actinomycetota bacterium]